MCCCYVDGLWRGRYFVLPTLRIKLPRTSTLVNGGERRGRTRRRVRAASRGFCTGANICAALLFVLKLMMWLMGGNYSILAPRTASDLTALALVCVRHGAPPRSPRVPL